MFRILTAASVLVALCLVPALPAGAATLEEVKTSVIDAFNDIKSLTSDIEISMSGGPGTSSEGSGTLAMLREDDVLKYVQEITISMEGPAPEDRTQVSLFDGEAVYVTTNVMGEEYAIKTDPEDGQGLPAPGGVALWDNLAESFELSVGEDTEVDGNACYTVTGKPAEPQGLENISVQFDKELGVARKITMAMAQGETENTIRYTDFEVNPELDAEMFVFKPEEGVDVVTPEELQQQMQERMQQQMQQQQRQQQQQGGPGGGQQQQGGPGGGQQQPPVVVE